MNKCLSRTLLLGAWRRRCLNDELVFRKITGPLMVKRDGMKRPYRSNCQSVTCIAEEPVFRSFLIYPGGKVSQG